MLIFIYNVTGLAVCIEHSGHNKEKISKTKGEKSGKHTSIAQNDECQCALHMQMNHLVSPELFKLNLPVSDLIPVEMPQPKTIVYRILIEYFSSRAPPCTKLFIIGS